LVSFHRETEAFLEHMMQALEILLLTTRNHDRSAKVYSSPCLLDQPERIPFVQRSCRAILGSLVSPRLTASAQRRLEMALSRQTF
jgi:hypothetical protein